MRSQTTHPPRLSQLGLFATISLIWGLTWIPTKVGVAFIPATLFAAVRGLIAGSLLLGLLRLRGGSLVVRKRDRAGLLVVALLAFALTYGLLFWGVGRVNSGVAAVVHFSLSPTLLLLFGVMAGEERVRIRSVTATAIGAVGLALLHVEASGSPASDAPAAGEGNLGLLAIVLGTAAYALGVVRSRPLLKHHPPPLVSGWSQLLGGGALLAYTVAMLPESLATLRHLARPEVLASLGFLVVFGSAVAFSLYLRLTHEWSPHRAGMYAFVSPAIAVAAGVVVLDETMRPTDWAAMAIMMTATWIALWPASERSSGSASALRGRGRRAGDAASPSPDCRTPPSNTNDAVARGNDRGTSTRSPGHPGTGRSAARGPTSGGSSPS